VKDVAEDRLLESEGCLMPVVREFPAKAIYATRARLLAGKMEVG
jgi:hypothetical protein